MGIVMNEHEELKDKLAAILSDHLNIEAPASDTDLIATGLMDSLALVELLLRLEQAFGVKVSVDDLEVDNFRSIESIARFIAYNRVVETVA